MNAPERKTLDRIAARLRKELPGGIASIYAFGSRVRGDHSGLSDFDVLVIVNDRTPEIESRVIEIFVEEEMVGGMNFTPVIKDSRVLILRRGSMRRFMRILRPRVSCCDA